MTMPKIIPIAMEDNDTVRRWMLIEDWEYLLGTIRIFIPKGFVFDGASIPKLFTAVYAPTGYLFIAALVHDYCYKHAGYREIFEGLEGSFFIAVDRRRADMIFRKIALVEYPNHQIKTWVAFKALRTGGWVAWDAHRRQDIVK